MSSKDLIVGVFYRPPKSKIIALQNLNLSLSKIKEKYPKAMILLGGDFNLPGIDWETLRHVTNKPKKEFCELLLQISVDSQLEQVNLEPTRGNNILELLFTSNPETISSCKTGPGISDHDSILIAKCRLRTAQNKKKPRTINLFQKTDWGAMKSAITMESVTFFETSPGSRTIEENWQIYKKAVLDTVAKLVPKKPSRVVSSFLGLPGKSNA